MNSPILLPAAPSPYCFRLPEKGEKDIWFGGTRTFWEELIRDNGHPAAVHSFAIRQPGAKRGIRFIDYESARAFMEQYNSGRRPQIAQPNL
jgi:hypothetical protein